MTRFVVAVFERSRGLGFERSWRLGELCALVGEFLCHGELRSGTEEAERR